MLWKIQVLRVDFGTEDGRWERSWIGIILSITDQHCALSYVTQCTVLASHTHVKQYNVRKLNWNYFVICNFRLKWENQLDRQIQHPSTQIALSQIIFWKSPHTTCLNPKTSDSCSLQSRHISYLVQSQCCQLILHINVSCIQLQFRHNSPFYVDWLCPCLVDMRKNEQCLDREHLWLQLWQ
jgi:hypothetical protein